MLTSDVGELDLQVRNQQSDQNKRVNIRRKCELIGQTAERN